MDARLDGAVVVASVSGGKDSAAMSLWLTGQGIPHHRVFADTGWEHPLTYEYLRGPLPAVIGEITWLKGARGFVDLVRWKQMFPSRLTRFCTSHLKVKPIAQYIAGLPDAVVNAVGLRAGESASRAALSEWDWAEHFDCHVWRPILTWTEADVIAIHKRHGLVPNPLYLTGATRVGCWPCIFARKAEIRAVAQQDPARIDEIDALEQALGGPTFFHSHEAGGAPIPIREYVRWSMQGTDQLDLFPWINDGCARWGMCGS